MFKLSARSRVAIVGAGPGGLCAAARLRQFGVQKTTLFESASTLGGTWRYSESAESDASSSMYANLRTNLPKECMAFPGFPFQQLDTSFPGHQQVLEYLKSGRLPNPVIKSYAEKHELESHIRYNERVIKVTKNESNNEWNVKTSNSEDNFDFVVVANGHYSRPSLPPLFESSPFSGPIIHSHRYRRPEEFSGKKVLVIGVGPSGTDISIDLLKTASSVSLLGGKEVANLPKNISMHIGWPVEVDEKGVRTTKNEYIECEAIVVSSGYEYDFSFLGEMVKLSDCGKKVHNLYRQILPVTQPTLGCIGVPSIVVPFPLIDCQVAWLIAVWSGKHKLPPMEKLIAESARVPGIGGDIERHFHKMGTAQWDYNDLLAREAGVDPIPRSIEKIYSLVHFQRREFGPVDYRNTKYAVIDDESFTTS